MPERVVGSGLGVRLRVKVESCALSSVPPRHSRGLTIPFPSTLTPLPRQLFFQGSDWIFFTVFLGDK